MLASWQPDIRDAFRHAGLCHDQVGILIDDAGNAAACSGSLHECGHGLSYNFEAIGVFTSWRDPSRTARKIEDFGRTWNHQAAGLEVAPFPEVARGQLIACHRPTFNHVLDDDLPQDPHPESAPAEAGPCSPTGRGSAARPGT